MKAFVFIASAFLLFNLSSVFSDGIFSEGDLNSVGDLKKTPAFCKKYQCPKYKVLNKTKDYEIREYAPSKWVVATDSSRLFVKSELRMYLRLHAYIQGSNKQNKKIPMTVPVSSYIPMGRTFEEYVMKKRRFYMAFYLPGQAPVPNDKRLKIVTVPKSVYYARQFAGHVRSERELIKEYLKLKKQIGQKSNGFVFAGYDSPKVVSNRHNEILVLKKKKKEKTILY